MSEQRHISEGRVDDIEVTDVVVVFGVNDDEIMVVEAKDKIKSLSSGVEIVVVDEGGYIFF